MKIAEIRDIVRIGERYGGKNFLSAIKASEDSKLEAFLNVILEGSILDEKEVAKKIFGKSFSPTRYKSLKSYFVSKVTRQLVSLDISGSGLSEYSKALFKAYKYLFFIRTLLSLGNQGAAIHFARRLIKLADKFELHIVSISLLQMLRAHAVQMGRESEYNRYLYSCQKKIDLLNDESAVKALEEKVLIHFAKSLFINEKFRVEVEYSLAIINDTLRKSETYLIRISYYRLQYVFHQIEGKPLKSAEVCREAIHYMESKRHLSPPSRFAEFALYELENYILARDFQKGQKVVKYCEVHINPGMTLWFTFKQYHFLLMMQTKQFTAAAEIFDEVVAHERYESLSTILKERWVLYGFYIKYVMQIISGGSGEEGTFDFRKSYLLRDKTFKEKMVNFPTYKKDKRGFNVAILTLTILVALEDNKLDILLKQEEALSSYRFKYLNEKHCQQSFALFKLIRLMTRNDFDISRIERKASVIEQDLKVATLKPGEVFENIQILPAEWVWNRIKAILHKRNHSR